jgi:hypothetical protein
MTDLETPRIPYLSDDRLLARQRHLVAEIGARRSRRHKRGIAFGGAGLTVSAVTAVLVVLLGAGTPSAFAAWTPSPTTPAPGQTAAAEAACETGAATPPPGGPATPTNVSLTDVRGPFTLLLFGTNTATQGALMCLSGPDGTHFSISSGSQPSLPGPDQITLARLQGESADGHVYTIAEGSTGSGVSAATLVLTDRSHVVTTIGNGLFLAWWPGGATVTSAILTARSRTVTQAIHSPAVDSPTQGAQITPRNYPNAVAFAQCMRTHGVPNFPNPTTSTDGEMTFGNMAGLNLDSPPFQDAGRTCEPLLTGSNGRLSGAGGP